MKCIGCKWGTRINENVIFCLAPGEACWKNDESKPESKKNGKMAKKPLIK